MWKSLLVLALATAFSVATSEYSCTFSEPIILDDVGDVELQHYVNEDEGTFTMKVTYYGPPSFVAIGVNQEGILAMTPAFATIGRNDDGEPQVDTYVMSALAGVELAESQDGIVSSSFEQTESTSILIFTQLLSATGQLNITDETQWLYAIGYEDNVWGGHVLRGGFQVRLARNCVLSTDEVEEEITDKEEETFEGVESGSSGAQPGLLISNIAPSNRAMWMTHGILMTLVWGLFAPLAIGAT
jgi:hypothetical protein